MMIAEILRRKGQDVVAVGPTVPLVEVCRVLSERRIGAVLVRDAAGAVLGILSERDIVRALAAGAVALSRPASEVMTRDVRTVEPRMRVDEALGLMTSARFRHLPVTEHGRLAGMVSIGDLVKARIDEAVAEAEELRAFVVSGA